MSRLKRPGAAAIILHAPIPAPIIEDRMRFGYLFIRFFGKSISFCRLC